MDFVDRLKEVKYATSPQKKKELGDVEGILHNQLFKFDLRPLRNNTKGGSFKTKADKIVYDMKDQYIIQHMLSWWDKSKSIKNPFLSLLIMS